MSACLLMCMAFASDYAQVKIGKLMCKTILNGIAEKKIQDNFLIQPA